MKIWKFIGSIVIVASAAVAGNVATVSQIPVWYESLNKPSFNPPNWLFGPAWTVLYLLMAVSFYLIWIAAQKKKTAAYVIFLSQLVLNALWSIIFFNAHQLGWALGELLLLWVAILLTIIIFYRISKTASFLLLPYLAWVTFAGILNFAVWQLN